MIHRPTGSNTATRNTGKSAKAPVLTGHLTWHSGGGSPINSEEDFIAALPTEEQRDLYVAFTKSRDEFCRKANESHKRQNAETDEEDDGDSPSLCVLASQPLSS
eukprot:SAG11_NODE_14146_length_623_cov_1.135496_1_plen_103_part_10